MDFYDWWISSTYYSYVGLAGYNIAKEAFEAGKKSNQDKIDTVLEYLKLQDGGMVIDIEGILNG